MIAQIVLALTLAVPINSMFAFGEEFGWRCYLLPRLMTLLGPWPGWSCTERSGDSGTPH